MCCVIAIVAPLTERREIPSIVAILGSVIQMCDCEDDDRPGLWMRLPIHRTAPHATPTRRLTDGEADLAPVVPIT
jgi:hypothetical protein